MSIETDTLVNETHLLVIDYVARLEKQVRRANDRIVMLECATEGYNNRVIELEDENKFLKSATKGYDIYVARLEKKVEWLKSYNDGLVVENDRLNALVQKINELIN